jgi:hypothetical protein
MVDEHTQIVVVKDEIPVAPLVASARERQRMQQGTIHSSLLFHFHIGQYFKPNVAQKYYQHMMMKHVIYHY